MHVRRGPGQRAGLTRAAVLAAAHELLARGGAGALTMRSLARVLDVAPNALYSHVRDKSALVDAVLDDLLGAVDTPDPHSADPVEGLAQLMSATYDVLTSHPEAVPLYLSRQGARGPTAVRLGEVVDALLVRAGVSPARIAPARESLIVHAIGFAAFAVSAPRRSEEERPPSWEQSRETFSTSLGWLLRGMEREA